IMRNYKRTTTRGDYCREAMSLAVAAVTLQGLSLWKATAQHNVNYKTLSRYADWASAFMKRHKE
ncbi:transposase, partial [Biomphalaria glabrata]